MFLILFEWLRCWWIMRRNVLPKTVNFSGKYILELKEKTTAVFSHSLLCFQSFYTSAYFSSNNLNNKNSLSLLVSGSKYKEVKCWKCKETWLIFNSSYNDTILNKSANNDRSRFHLFITLKKCSITFQSQSKYQK